MSKIILFTSLVLTLLFVVLIVLVDFHNYKFCGYSCQSTIINVGESFFFFPVVFFFSFITYFAPERVFVAWWKFVKFAMPVVFILLLIINLGLLHGKNDAWPALTDIPALILLYSIFTIGSVWQIWKGWRSA